MEPLIPDGYIMLARKIRRSPLWLSLKATHRIVMLEILLQAQFQDGEVVRNGEIIFLKRGQMATSYQMLVDDIADKDITVKVVRNAIDKLLKHDFLAKDETKARAKKGLLLTVVKYEDYQNPDNYKGKAKGKEEGITWAKQGQSKGKEGAINNNGNKGDKVEKEKKLKYADFVKLTKTEYERLVSEFGEQATILMIRELDDYKAMHGKKYADDNRAIRKWVKDKVFKENPQIKIGTHDKQNELKGEERNGKMEINGTSYDFYKQREPNF
jgi:hypothetical protein